MFNSWLHVLALIAYFGAVIGFSVLLIPAVASVPGHTDRVHFLVRALKFYNPLQVGALGIVLFSGAFALTHLKEVYRETFVKQLGYNLAIKLVFAFLLVIFSVYQTMGIGHRIVRRQELGESITPQELDSALRRLKTANWCIVVLALITIWLGLRLQS
jgi:uncharacterized membrane protein